MQVQADPMLQNKTQLKVHALLKALILETKVQQRLLNWQGQDEKRKKQPEQVDGWRDSPRHQLPEVPVLYPPGHWPIPGWLIKPPLVSYSPWCGTA
jgi:hypothetical protein